MVVLTFLGKIPSITPFAVRCSMAAARATPHVIDPGSDGNIAVGLVAFLKTESPAIDH